MVNSTKERGYAKWLRTLNDLVSSSGEAGTLKVLSPFNNRILGHAPISSDQDVEKAFVSARAAQKSWSARPVEERQAVADRFGKLVLQNRKRLLDLVQAETGKSRSAGFEEVVDLVLWANFVYRKSHVALAEDRVPGALPILTQTHVRRVPWGVVGVITPWNYPLTLPGTDSLPALVAGNSVVLKPDSLTPYSALAIVSLLYEAGVPKDVLQVVVGSGSTVGEMLTDRADYVVFTGSTATGRGIGVKCAERLIEHSAELGGKNPLVVLADANVDAAVNGAVQACFSNTGQLCISIERIYVVENHWDQFVPRFVAATKKLRIGAGYDWRTDVGSLISKNQLEKVSHHVTDAARGGAKVLAGGVARPDLGPFFYEPTVLADVTPEMEVYGEETFGPVVSLYKVPTDEDAIRAANDTTYGLNASVWGGLSAQGRAQQMQAGTVNVNDGYGAAWASYGAPMGGMKHSGVGRRHGLGGISKYTQQQTIAHQHLVPVSGPRWVPHKTWSRVLTVAAKAMRSLP